MNYVIRNRANGRGIQYQKRDIEDLMVLAICIKKRGQILSQATPDANENT